MGKKCCCPDIFLTNNPKDNPLTSQEGWEGCEMTDGLEIRDRNVRENVPWGGGILTRIDDAAMGIRTPVVGVKGRHDWPDYTISAVP